MTPCVFVAAWSTSDWSEGVITSVPLAVGELRGTVIDASNCAPVWSYARMIRSLASETTDVTKVVFDGCDALGGSTTLVGCAVGVGVGTEGDSDGAGGGGTSAGTGVARGIGGCSKGAMPSAEHVTTNGTTGLL